MVRLWMQFTLPYDYTQGDSVYFYTSCSGENG